LLCWRYTFVMDKNVLDVYTDYLISSFGLTTATGLSTLLGGTLSHDRISRFLKAPTQKSADLWKLVKPVVRQVQGEDGVLIIDDSVEENPTPMRANSSAGIGITPSAAASKASTS